ncbi:MAG: type 1 glutamine amidotransferase [Halanaeroarchaeum sp.]
MGLEFALLDASFSDDDAPRNFSREFDADVVAYDVREGDLPPTPGDGWPHDGVVVSGSAASVYWNREWIDDLRGWLERAVRTDLPTLGVCFGHQLLAEVLGGRVRSMGEYELGYHMIRRTGASDLLAGLDDWFVAFTAHSDEVVAFPRDATVIARNPYSAHGFRRGTVYGVQFHPEMDLASATSIMAHRGVDGETVEHMIATANDGAHNEAADARTIFQHFESIAR